MTKERELAREQALLYQIYLYENNIEQKKLQKKTESTHQDLSQLRVFLCFRLFSSNLSMIIARELKRWKLIRSK